MRRMIVVLFVLTSLLASCGESGTAAVPPPATTPTPIPSAPPTEIPTAIATFTPAPTSEPTPAPTNVPTAEPSPLSLTAETSPLPQPPVAPVVAEPTESTSGHEAVAPVGETCPPEAPIKGNINREQEKIYHMPKGRDYDKTTPEYCFASEAAAQDAGFRKAKR